jgi:phage-related protein
MDTIVFNPNDIKVLIQDNLNSGVIERALSELTIEDVERAVVEFGGLTDPLGQLQNWLSNQLSGLVTTIENGIESIIAPVINAVNSVISTITTGINSIPSLIQTGISNFVNSIMSTLSSITSSLSSIGNSLDSWFNSIAGTISTGISQVISSITSSIASVSSALQSIGSSILSSISGAIGSISSAISGLGSSIQSSFSGAINTITSVVSQITNAIGKLGDAIKGVGDLVKGSLDKFGDELKNIVFPKIEDFVNKVKSGFDELGDKLKSAIGEIVGYVKNGLSDIGKFFENVWNNLKTTFTDIGNQIKDFFGSVGKYFKSFIGDVENFGKSLYGAFSKIGGYIESFGKTVENAVSGVVKGIEGIEKSITQVFTNVFNEVGGVITGFTKSISTQFTNFLKTVGSFANAINATLTTIDASVVNTALSIGGAFTTVLNDITQTFENVKKTFENLPTIISKVPEAVFNAIYKAFMDFLKTLNLNTMIDAFSKLGKFIESIVNSKWWSNVINMFELMGKGIEGMFEELYSTLKAVFDWVVKELTAVGPVFINLGKEIYNGILSVRNSLSAFVKGLIGDTVNAVFIPVLLSEIPFMVGETVFKSEPVLVLKSGADPTKVVIPDLAGAFGAISAISLGTFGSIYAIGKFIEKLGKATGSQEVDAAPFGIGVRLRLLLGKLVEPFGDLVSKVGEEIGRGMALSGSLAFLEPLRYIWRYVWWLTFYSMGMGNIPFELPGHGEMFDIARRFDITQNINNIANTMIYRGFPYWFIAKTVALPSVFTSIDVANQALGDYKKEIQNNYITVVDKFGNTRVIPIAPLFELPTTHDLVEFMLRDLFLPASASPDKQPILAYQSFVKAMWARGVPPDVAYMYYLRAYELPSATQVWEFTMRALSGFAWYIPPSEVQTFAASEAKIINAFVPQTPADLNFKYDLALLALAEYQKWHGRAHFAWINDPKTGQSYTSDAWLIIDQSAHLLDRGDIEHLVRHGIWDYYEREYKITNETTMYTMLTKIVEPQATSPIQIYTDYVTNVLMARGFHPYVAPLISLRAVFDVTTAAKTLLRTGLLNLIRENVETIPTTLQMMSFMFPVSVHVSYFDMYSQKWVSGWLNAPVRYIEPEAKLMMLRALMDKVNTFMRNMFRAVLTGTRDYLIGLSDSLNFMVNYVTSVLDKYYAPLYKSITGVEMHLTWDSTFNDAITKYFEVEQLIGTFRRVRYYARYALYRILGLIGMGVIPKTEIPKYIDEMVTLMRETPQAKEVFMFISDLVYRRYLLRNFETYARIWLGRHATTPDTALQTLLTQGLDPDFAKALIEAYSPPYYPTILELATLSEYVPQFMTKLTQVTQLMRIPSDWVSLWENYVEVRAYLRWFTRVLNELITVLAMVPTTIAVVFNGKQTSLSDVSQTILKEAESYGFDPTKLGLVSQLIDLRVSLTQYRNSIPPPRTALGYSVYLPDPVGFINTLSKYWIINTTGLSILTDMAKYRKYNRWIHQAVTELIRAYALGYITKKVFTTYLTNLQPFGISQFDIEAITQVTQAYALALGLPRFIETMVRVWLGRHAITPSDALTELTNNGFDPTLAQAIVNAYAPPYYPSITQLITMATYNPAYLSMFNTVTQLMRIPNDWVKIWQDYATIRAYVRWFTRALNELVIATTTLPTTVKITMPMTQGNKTVTLQDIVSDMFKTAKSMGFDDTKLNFVKELIDLRYVVRQFRNSIPTPWHALTLTYYLPDPDTFIDDLAKNWIISDYGKSLLKTLAKFRKYGRWMFETVYWAVRAYARGALSGQGLLQFLQSLQPYGLSKYEIDMIRNWAFAVSCYYGSCQYPW